MTSLHKAIPRILFKYREINQRTFEILNDRKIFFPSRTRFNDPFDCSIPIRYDHLSEDEHDEFALELLQTLRPNDDDRKLRRLIKQMKKLGEQKKVSAKW